MAQTSIFFDMDGTIADLYGVEDWLSMLRDYNPTPYKIAKPLVNMRVFARLVHALQAEGIKVGVISWLSKNSTPDYDIAVARAKQKWLYEHLKSVDFDEIHIVAYGTPKHTIPTERNSILFDDEKKNVRDWEAVFGNSSAFSADNILEKLKKILTKNS